MLQLDLYGARKVKDFDGEELGESALAQKYAVRFTPTMQFFPAGRPEPRNPARRSRWRACPATCGRSRSTSCSSSLRTKAYKTASFRDYAKRKHGGAGGQGRQGAYVVVAVGPRASRRALSSWHRKRAGLETQVEETARSQRRGTFSHS